MKSFRLLLAFSTVLFFLPLVSHAQDYLQYRPSAENPYGLPHPDAPEQLADFAPLIGQCQCGSLRRNPDGTWADTTAMIWEFKYIMNGWAIQDETWKADGIHSGSIRQFNPDSLLWYVSYYSSNAAASQLPVWSGQKEGEDIVLYMPQKAPNGSDGFSRLTFYDISEQGYKWKGEWVDITETIVYPFWKIDCKKTVEKKKENPKGFTPD